MTFRTVSKEMALFVPTSMNVPTLLFMDVMRMHSVRIQLVVTPVLAMTVSPGMVLLVPMRMNAMVKAPATTVPQMHLVKTPFLAILVHVTRDTTVMVSLAMIVMNAQGTFQSYCRHKQILDQV